MGRGPGARLRPTLVTRFALLCSLWILAVHLDWEARAGMDFPDHHSALFLGLALDTLDWLVGVSGDPFWHPGIELGRPPFPPTAQGPGHSDYPPVAFLPSALAMAALGPDLVWARLAQWGFVVVFLVAMGRVGQLLGGVRGGLLTVLACASSPWTAQYLRQFSQVPAQLALLALALGWLLRPASLGSARGWGGLGLTVGLGTLVMYSYLLPLLPLAAAAMARLPLGRPAARKGGLLTAGVMALFCLVPALGHPAWLGSAWGPWVSVPVALVLLGWLHGRLAALHAEEPGCPTLGFCRAVALASMVAAPWYLVHLDLMWAFVAEQTSHLPDLAESLSAPWQVLVGAGSLQPSQAKSVLVPSVLNHRFVHQFHWAGLGWIGVGAAVSLWDREAQAAARQAVVGALGAYGLLTVLLPTDPRYLAILFPLLAAVAFPWAGRRVGTWWASLLILLCVALPQSSGWPGAWPKAWTVDLEEARELFQRHRPEAAALDLRIPLPSMGPDQRPLVDDVAARISWGGILGVYRAAPEPSHRSAQSGILAAASESQWNPMREASFEQAADFLIHLLAHRYRLVQVDNPASPGADQPPHLVVLDRGRGGDVHPGQGWGLLQEYPIRFDEKRWRLRLYERCPVPPPARGWPGR